MNEITMKLVADKLIMQALEEDITSEDITTNAVMRERREGEVELICRLKVPSKSPYKWFSSWVSVSTSTGYPSQR